MAINRERFKKASEELKKNGKKNINIPTEEKPVEAVIEKAARYNI